MVILKKKPDSYGAVLEGLYTQDGKTKMHIDFLPHASNSHL